MNLFTLVLVATAVSIDGFWGGFAFGLRKIKIKLSSLVIIAFWSVVCSMITMVIGHNLKEYIDLNTAKYVGAGLLLLLGLFTLREGHKNRKQKVEQQDIVKKFSPKDILKVLQDPLIADIDKENDIKPIEGTILGIAVAMDASIAAFTVALFGFSPFTTPFLFGATHFVLIGLGNLVARHRVINYVGDKFSLLPGIILMILAMLRLV